MKLKLYAYHVQWSWEEEGKLIYRSTEVGEEADSTRLRKLLGEVEVEVPEFPLLTKEQCTALLVNGLKAGIQQIQADAHVRVQQLEEKIQQLLCLEHKSA